MFFRKSPKQFQFNLRAKFNILQIAEISIVLLKHGHPTEFLEYFVPSDEEERHLLN